MEQPEITLIIDDPKEKDPEVLLDEAEKDIEREIQILQEQLALSREIKRKKELEKDKKDKKIEALRAEIVAKTLQHNMEIADILKQIEDVENNKTIDVIQIIDDIGDDELNKIVTNKTNATNKTNKKSRIVVKRRPLYEVIKQPTKFKTLIKGTENICYTDDGRKIISKGIKDENNGINTFNSLNEWLEHTILSLCKVNTTKKSVYEVVLYYNNEKKEWRSLKMDYTSETVVLN